MTAVTGRRRVEVARLRADELRPAEVDTVVAVVPIRCAIQSLPLVVIGRSAEGIPVSQDGGVVTFVILVITSEDRPELEGELLVQLARLAADPSKLDRLQHATLPADVLELIPKAQLESEVRPMP